MMSGSDSSATATLTPTPTPTSVAVISAASSAADEEEEDSAALTLDCVESAADMDLVNGPNPWLPAYGFQLQHHSHFQPTHFEDLRPNDTVVVQQIDFLETILEETSDDLQSDSDRSGTTYWLGSDSETESVIHIKAKQRSTDERLDGSGSECNSVVPKKRRRRDHCGTDHLYHQHVTTYDEYPASPRSSRSTASSRSSSLLQFESLERTCATLSPSSYSFDSLEYSNRSNASHAENDSPDSLEQDYDRLLPNGFPSTLTDHFPKIRPYRSFESLDTCQKDEGFVQASMSNGFAPLYLKRGADLSNIGKNKQCPRDFWHEDEEYRDHDYEGEDDEDNFEEYERNRTNTDSRLMTDFEDRLLLYGESGKYATSLDYRNTIDLREIGVETKRDMLLELKSGQKTARLNIAGYGAEHHHHHHHHHHHQHSQQQQQQQQYQQQQYQQQYDQHDHHHHHHRRRCQQQHQGWSHEERFNFRFTDKSQSAPSLLDSVEESARSDLSSTSLFRLRTSRTTSYVSTSSLFENYTQVASVPVDLNLCGVAATCDDGTNDLEMAETTSDNETVMTLKNSRENATLQENDEIQTKTKLISSVRTQSAQNSFMNSSTKKREKKNEERTKVESVNDHCEKERTHDEQIKPVSMVKTQDRTNCMLDMTINTEHDLDEAIKQFKREVEEAAASEVANAAILAMETIQRTSSGRVRNRKVKKNASYELAQQFEVDERNFQRKFKNNDEDRSTSPSSPGRRRIINNASYELAQQCDYLNALQSSKAAFHRMDACDELEEASGRSSELRITDVTHSNTNISKDSSYSSPIEQDDSFFGQIKKNSDPFLVCGDASALNPRLLDDEVDYPCLETKPIEASCLENRVVLREKIELEKPNVELESALGNSTMVSYIDEEPFGKREDECADVKENFISEFYPERMTHFSQQYPRKDENKETNQERDKENFEIASSNQDLEERSRSPASNDRDTDECLWRVVIEKPAAAKKGTEEEKREEVEVTEKKEKEEKGHSVRSVVGSESPPGDSGSFGEHSSGKPAMAVAAVDTNHRGSDRDKRQSEEQRALDINKKDAVAKRPLFVAPQKETAKTYAASSASSLSSSASAIMKNEERKKGGLGGFLQRFSRLRFSGRTKVPRSEAQKKVVEPTTRTQEEQQSAAAKKKEPDYIIIPLHPPEGERRRQQEVVTLEEAARRNNVDLQRSVSNVSSNGRAPVSSKPPLPPQPPRVAALGTTRASASASASRRRAATDLGNPAAIEMAKARAMQAAQERPVGLLETDLDEAVIDTSCTKYIASSTAATATAAAATAAAAAAAAASAAAAAAGAGGKKTRSLLDLNHTSAAAPRPRPEHALHVPQSPVDRSPRDDVASAATSAIHQRPHKSMEFLLDKENLHFVKPPENELQKVGERVPSEHELRVQRSLQRLNVPDWYKNSPAARDGFRLKRHSDASQHGGWRALGSKTTSLSSLSSSSNRQPTTGALLSPSPTPPVFSRWSTSLLNSAGSSPANSARSSFNHRQPYLGWRSQERLTNPRTPAERLAQGILPQLQAANKQQQQQQTTNQQLEVRNSIKEVTSAIVHYVQSGQEVGGGGGGRLSPRPRPEDWDDRGGARSTSPRGSVKLCWMESSFVGTRPVDSPETPMSLATDQEAGDCCNAAGTESCSCQDSAASGLYLDLTPSRDDLRHHQTSSAGPSPTSSSHYHHHHHHHHQRHQHRQQQQQQQCHHRGSGQSDTDEAMATAALLRNKPSPGSTTLEDVLDSLLGLPPASRTPSPGPGGPVVTATSAIRHRHTNAAVGQAKAGKSCSDLRQDLQESARSVMDVHQVAAEDQRNFYSGELLRRKSEGSDTLPVSRTATAASSSSLMPNRGGATRHRRVSFDNAQDSTTNGSSAVDKVVRCRNNKCGNSTTLAEARRTYKSCHNCTCLYCSRECRRAHWQRHRRTCLHSRAGSLCRQVLSSAKEDPTTLKHISALARRGHDAHGRGAVKCFFSSPEAAERFVGNGFADLGEPTYVRWPDLLPGEMGAELYAELMRLCKTYNPEARLVLYVAVCVVSEVPTSGAVRWERQLVSRCAKIRLDGATKQHASSSSASPQARRQQMPASPCNITREMDSPETLVLTSLPGNNGQNTPRRAREISFTNIQRQLRLRGVSLRRHFPQVYRKLCSYVDGSVDKFAPVTIYPRDQASGKSFMCIIMLDAEPERLQLLPTDSSRVRTVDISVEQE